MTGLEIIGLIMLAAACATVGALIAVGHGIPKKARFKSRKKSLSRREARFETQKMAEFRRYEMGRAEAYRQLQQECYDRRKKENRPWNN